MIIEHRFGSAGTTAISGECLILSPEKEDETVAAMRDYGYTFG